MLNALLVFHAAVLGYWLGAEFVINSTFRHLSYADGMGFEERDRLFDHVMNADQHVRYALILQLWSGLVLAIMFLYLPLGVEGIIAVSIICLGWLGLVELTHKRRKQASGVTLGQVDRCLRYLLIALLLLVAGLAIAGSLSMPLWLAIKLALFSGVVACGLAIRLELIRYYVHWNSLKTDGGDAAELGIRAGYRRATRILLLLWSLIAAIAFITLIKST